MQFDTSVLQSILNNSNEAPKVEKFQETVDTHTVKLGPFQEWRFELKAKDKMKLKLESGTAEIFGTELSSNFEYNLEGSLKSCVSSFQGCTLKYWNCQTSSEYVGEETCLGSYLNLHLALENRRMSPDFPAPRVLVVGARDSGKTSLCRVLVSYAEKMERRPMLVNLSPKDSLFTMPGSLTCTAVSGMLNVENVSLGETITTGPSFYHAKQPLVKCFGLENYRDNLKFYRYLIRKIGEAAERRMANSADVRDAGLVIDTPAFHIGDCDVIQEIIDGFKIDVLVVVGNERLLVDLKRKLRYNPDRLTLLKVGRSSGCVDKDDRFGREMQQRAIKEYFYGIDRSQLSPYTIVVNPRDFIFVQPKVNASIDEAFMPEEGVSVKTEEGGSAEDFMERVRKPSAENLQNAILALADDSGLEVGKYVTDVDDAAGNKELIASICGRNVLGYCYVQEVNDEKGKMKLLIPSPVQQLPTKTMILTQMRYHE